MEPGQFGVSSPLYVSLRAAISGATILLLGLFSLRFILLPVARRQWDEVGFLLPELERRSRRWAIAAVGTIAVATVARLLAQHAAIFGTVERPTADSLSALILQSVWGQAWSLAVLGSVIASVALINARQRVVIRWRVLAVGALLIVVSQPLSGHPAAAASVADAVAIQVLHIIGAGGWIGTLAAVVLVAIPATGGPPAWGSATPRDAVVAALVRAFSPVALGFALLLVSSGGLAAWRNLGGVAPLFGSEYGRVLLAKLSLLGITAGVGAYNWKRVLPSLGEASATERLGRSARVELAAAVLVVLATAVLVATPTEMP